MMLKYMKTPKGLYHSPGSLALVCISSKATLQKRTEDVKLRGKLLSGREKDLPHMIWLPEMLEPATNFEPFFMRKYNKVLNMRNVWLVDYRNNNMSDHHESFDLHEMGADIVRFMDTNNIKMATIGGHGFGAKLASVTAIDNLDRFTGIFLLDGGPLDQTYHQAFIDFKDYLKSANEMNMKEMKMTDAQRYLAEHIPHTKWRRIFLQNIEEERDSIRWKSNILGYYKNSIKFRPDLSSWHAHYGFWPGQALALFAAYSPWIHLSTNTLPFYKIFPIFDQDFGRFLNMYGDDQTENNHWMHEHPKEDIDILGSRIARWLRWNDGCNILLKDKSEAGWKYIADRGYSPGFPYIGESTPEHVHFDYDKTDAYERSRERRGKEQANRGQYQAMDKFSNEDSWL